MVTSVFLATAIKKDQKVSAIQPMEYVTAYQGIKGRNATFARMAIGLKRINVLHVSAIMMAQLTRTVMQMVSVHATVVLLETSVLPAKQSIGAFQTARNVNV